MKQIYTTITLAILLGAIAGAASAFLVLNLQTQSDEDRIEEFYLTETAVHVSPHHIRKAMDKGDDSFILVDLRSQEEYEQEHIIGAINIPAYSSPDKSDYDAVERIVSEFAKLPKDKDIIVYCYSIPCMTGRKVGKMLSENEIYVKHLGIGWNEWRYYWELWNHEHELNVTDVNNYISSGSDSGIPPTNTNSSICPLEGNLSC